MGKKSDRESLIRVLANTIAHEIVARHTNRSESKKFLDFEVIEYRGQTRKIAKQYNWSKEDKEYIKEKTINKVKEKLDLKYSDISYDLKEIDVLADEEVSGL